ncbi:hypothetical protein BFP70_05130 [Thioclava sp. SK-1]|uniref:glycosyltransferase n=1 Tax=Thioclava sp. SK-1 TaxID=1889770 RepID=UPI000826AC43|nr:glycosyltransferase [Thioclava sp. SK-1]OCX66408.1 hypothetical protein BFP70_05130 [Thioclava sp. SK-1]
MQRYLDIGVFAHNEAAGLADMLHDLLRQDIFTDPDISIQLHVLANGCSDDTADIARRVLAHLPPAQVCVHDFTDGGKSRTWNRFVHEQSRQEAEVFLFLDADITIPQPDMLRQLLQFLLDRPDLSGASSRPVKDLAHDPSLIRGPLDRVITMAGGGLDDWKGSICGQLYLLRADVARNLYLPIGLPVEDGFVRAMVQTNRFQTTRDLNRLDGRDGLFHVYASERNLGALIRHQTRIVIGGAINDVVFSDLNGRGPDGVSARLAQVAGDPDWLARYLAEKLPSPSGYVPRHFLTKRLSRWRGLPDKWRPKRMVITALGFGLDAIVYLRARRLMARGQGAGHW